MKRNIYILFILLSVVLSLKSQTKNKDSILYIMPDKVELQLYEYINSLDSSKYSFEFFLSKLDKDKYRICVGIWSNLNTNYWHNNTNRFILIDEKKYPLWYDYDVTFSTKNKSNLGKMGSREGQILKIHPIFDGYTIDFNLKGEIFSENDGVVK